jgi:hypothetical protein
MEMALRLPDQSSARPAHYRVASVLTVVLFLDFCDYLQV